MYHGTDRMPIEIILDSDQVLLGRANVGLDNQLHKGRTLL